MDTTNNFAARVALQYSYCNCNGFRVLAIADRTRSDAKVRERAAMLPLAVIIILSGLWPAILPGLWIHASRGGFSGERALGLNVAHRSAL